MQLSNVCNAFQKKKKFELLNYQKRRNQNWSRRLD